jgi:hypothetical protein
MLTELENVADRGRREVIGRRKRPRASRPHVISLGSVTAIPASIKIDLSLTDPDRRSMAERTHFGHRESGVAVTRLESPFLVYYVRFELLDVKIRRSRIS